MTKKIFLALLLFALLLAACAGGDDGDDSANDGASSQTAAGPTDEPAPPPTDEPPTEEPAVEETATAEPAAPEPDVDDDFPPGIRFETTGPLPAGGEHGFVLLASPGDALVVGAEPLNGQDIALGLFFLTGGPRQQVLLVNDGPAYEQLVYTFEAAGAYVLAVGELSDIDGEYLMRVASSPGLAPNISPGTDVQGKFEQNDRLEVLHNVFAGLENYLVVTPESDELDISISIMSLNDMDTVLFSADANGPGEVEELTFNAPEDGQYLIRIERVSGGSGVVSIMLEEINN